MKDFGGKLAVITGGGTGMGRELARQLIAEGCDVAICDVSATNMAETVSICESEAPQGVRISSCVADVASEPDVLAFRDHVNEFHNRGYINLLFNNAGIGGGGVFVDEAQREEWERTFNICWFGVYNNARAFFPLLKASDEGHIINTSSVNGFWASLGPNTSHTAYAAAKFAVKGFTEALINDCKLNAPHVKVSLVMPGHIGTSIAINSGEILRGGGLETLTGEDLESVRAFIENAMGVDASGLTEDQLRAAVKMQGEAFRDNAPTTAAEAAEVILNGVREERWRILIGDDARVLDELVRADPENAYSEAFMETLRSKTVWELGS